MLVRSSALGFAALAALSLVSVASCSSSGGAQPAADAGGAEAEAGSVGAPRTDPGAVHVVGSTFRDGQGRQLLFRGYNAKIQHLFDASFTDGRVPEETWPDFVESEAAEIETLGWNVMRIPLSWSGLEPQPLAYADAFFQQLDVLLGQAQAHHFYVLLDMHQDAYSKEIGEDGQPLWAIVPPPTQLLQGPYDDARRTTGQVLSAGYSFFDDANATDGRGLQEAYIAAVQKMAAHVLGNPAVLGYEAFNEPVVLDYHKLDAFHQAFADGVHAVDADAPVLFEPVSTRNETDDAVISASPWANGPGCYAVHIYTGQFSLQGQWTATSMDPSILAPSMAHAELERAAWGTPLFVTEFGCDLTQPQGPPWMSAELDLQDQYLASSTAWEYQRPGGWCFHDDTGAPRPEAVHVMTRSFPRAVAGDLVKIERPAAGDMVVTYRPTAATAGLPHEVSLSAQYITSPVVKCDGQVVTFTQLTGRATFVCPVSDQNEHTFEVQGTPVK